MDDSEDLYINLCKYENLEKAFIKARKRKTLKSYVIEFEKNLEENLLALKNELIFHTYKPKPLETFIIRDPKTRKISKSDFRDRVVHHTLVNVIEPIFDKTFVYDSYANRLGKGTFNAIKRFDYFKRKVSRNNTRTCFVLKADIKHYFETVDHEILMRIIKKRIKDKRILWLIKRIISNHKTQEKGKGMPLGNLTSQFFANIYLNELDQFVKHKLKARYYIRYVDDFIILHSSRKILQEYKDKIDEFLKINLGLELHKDKSKILRLDKGVSFLGFRIFFYHKLVKKKNLNHFERKFKELRKLYKEGLIDREKVIEKIEGWLSYVSNANTFKYRRNLMKIFNHYFAFKPNPNNEISNKKRYENYIKKINESNIKFSAHKTLYLFKKGMGVKEISEKRNIKESTVWEHFAKLIEFNQISIWKILPKKKIYKILSKINTKKDLLKDIKERLEDKSITFDEINCVLANVKCKKNKH